MAPVCRRFRQLCCSPELLRDVTVVASSTRALPTAHALLPWLVRHAAHVQLLDLTLAPLGGATEAKRSELAGLITGCAVAVAGRLQMFVLHQGTPADLAWLPAMRSLRRLIVGSDCELRVVADVSGLPALENLSLRGRPLRFEAPARLPTSLTRLEVADRRQDTEMPQQVHGQQGRGGVVYDVSPRRPACLSNHYQRLVNQTMLLTSPPLALQLALLPNLRHLSINAGYSPPAWQPSAVSPPSPCWRRSTLRRLPAWQLLQRCATCASCLESSS